MERPRPAAVQVIGILHLIIGGLGILSLLAVLAMGGGMMAGFQQPGHKQQMQEFERTLQTKAPAYRA